jgi:hypothetical protein
MSFAKAARISACIALMSTGSQAFAASATGTIAKYRLDSRPQHAAVCIQLEPPISGKVWACLSDLNTITYQKPNGAVYIEPCPHFSELIQDAYLSRKTCTISWDFIDVSGYAVINAVECRQ